MSVVAFNCRICGSFCGMLVTVEDGRIVKVAGDPDHPRSRGYTCIKGRSIPALHDSPRRLDRPRLHGEEVSWDVLLDDMAERMQRVLAEGGPNRIAKYSGTGINSDAGQFIVRRLMDGLGSRQLYSTLTLDVAPLFRATELVTGSFLIYPSWSPDEPTPTLSVLVGVNPPVTAGYIGAVGTNWMQRLRRFRKRGGELWVIDPRETKSARLADRHLAPRPGTDVFFLAWLVRELLEEGYDAHELEAACHPEDVERLRAAVAPFDLAAVVERTGLEASDLLDLLAAIRRHKKFAITAGTGVAFQASGVFAHWLIWAAMIVTGSLDQEGGLRFFAPSRAALDGPPLAAAPADGAYAPGPVSRPDLAGVFGDQPSVALVDEIEAGEVRALIIIGGDPIAAAPEPDRMRAALAKLEVLAVFDVFENPLTEIATHVIPCTWMTERTDFLGLAHFGKGRAFLSPALVPPGAERRHAWWVFAQLGRRLDIDVLNGLDPDTVDEATVTKEVAAGNHDYAESVFEAGPVGADAPVRYGWFREKVLPGGRWRVAPQVLVDRLPEVWNDDGRGLRLVSGRILESVNAAPYLPGEQAPPPIHVSADAAREQGIATGDRIRVSSPSGMVEGHAHVDETLARQSIWINHGWHEQNVNALVDPTTDRLTGQPVFTAFRVRLERLDAVGAEAHR